jgi:hypothetical protein
VAKYYGKVIRRSDGTTITFPPDNVFSPVDPGDVDIDLEESPSVQQFSKGTKLEDAWGRVFRYVEYGNTVAQADLTQAEAPNGSDDDLDITAASAGDTSVVTTTTGSVSVNEYAQGWLYAEQVVSGIAYPISDHAVYSSAAMTFNLFVPIRTAIVADADVSLVKSKYSEVIQAAVTPTGQVIGVNAANGAVDGDFGWVQTVGPAKVRTAGTVVIGNTVIGITTAGRVAPAGDNDSQEPQLGEVMNVGPNTEWSLVDLHLE